MSLDADELTLVVLNGSLQRIVAARELREMGITASPADVEAWLSMTSRYKREVSLLWAIYAATGAANPRNPGLIPD